MILVLKVLSRVSGELKDQSRTLLRVCSQKQAIGFAQGGLNMRIGQVRAAHIICRSLGKRSTLEQPLHRISAPPGSGNTFGKTFY